MLWKGGRVLPEQGFYKVNRALLAQNDAFQRLLVAMKDLEASLKNFNNFLVSQMEPRH